MTNKSEILSELKEISSVVAGLGTKTPYQVPAGYFDELAGRILARLQEADTELTLPFEKSALNNPFTIPDNYFESLSDLILNRIKAEEASSHKEEITHLSPVLGQLDKKVPFSVPGDYFQKFPEDVIAGVAAIDFVNQELNPETSAVIPGDLKNVYTVPDNYFENLPQEVLQKVKFRKRALVIPMLFTKGIARYAVAALFAGVISVGAWLFLRDASPANTAADLGVIENISTDEISNYLETNSVAPDEDNTTATADIREEDLRDLLADLSDAELKNYLDQRALSKDPNTN